jgi:hypothetical protein
VLPFRQRGAIFRRSIRQAPPADDLAKYEHAEPEREDDYRHRMRMNALTAVLVLLLIGAGLWIADTMAQMRKDQDCVLSGRRGCTPVEVPIQPR